MNEIPPMTHPYAKYWDQPDRSEILLDDTHALMTQASFVKLHEYSSTIPTGAFEGKMWRRHDGLYDPTCKPESYCWRLMWYGGSDKPDMVSINHRIILLC